MCTSTDLIHRLSSSASDDRLGALKGLFGIHICLVAKYASKRLSLEAALNRTVALTADDVIALTYMALSRRVEADPLYLPHGLAGWRRYLRKAVLSAVSGASRRGVHARSVECVHSLENSDSHHLAARRLKRRGAFAQHFADKPEPINTIPAACDDPMAALAKKEFLLDSMEALCGIVPSLTQDQQALLQGVFGAFSGSAVSIAQVGRSIGVSAGEIHALFAEVRRLHEFHKRIRARQCVQVLRSTTKETEHLACAA